MTKFDPNIHDGIIFLDKCEPFIYKNPDSPIESHQIGLKYHIAIVNHDNSVELFDAILGDPNHYLQNLKKINLHGFIAKKTQNSNNIIYDMFHALFDK